jgi:ketosteroid isomerase-like protein
MARDNVEFVRGIYATGAWDSDGDARAALPYLVEDFEYVNPAHAVVAGRRHGHDGFVAAMEGMRDAFSSWRHDLLAFEPAGERVLVSLRFLNVARHTGIEFARMEWHVWLVREGRAASVAWFHDEDDARREAGIE